MRPLLLLFAITATSVAATPVQITHQGRLLDAAGGVINGPHDLRISLHDAASGGAEVWTESFAQYPVENGVYSVVLGAAGTLPHDLFDSPMWVQIDVDTVPMGARSPLTSVPSAASVNGRVRVGDETVGCTAGQVGRLRFHQDTLQVCVTSGWRTLRASVTGLTATDPAASCLAVHQSDPQAASGLYWVDPNGGPTSDAFQVYCDMRTDGGGWTQIMYDRRDAEGQLQAYASVFSSTARGDRTTGSYMIDASGLLAVATEFRYSEPSGEPTTGDLDTWAHDLACGITTNVRANWLNPGSSNQVPAAISCHHLATGASSTSAVLTNYQHWTGAWIGPRLWIGSAADAPSYHGDYCTDCVVTWKSADTTVGVYSGPSNATGGGQNVVAFWLR